MGVISNAGLWSRKTIWRLDWWWSGVHSGTGMLTWGWRCENVWKDEVLNILQRLVYADRAALAVSSSQRRFHPQSLKQDAFPAECSHSQAGCAAALRHRQHRRRHSSYMVQECRPTKNDVLVRLRLRCADMHRIRCNAHGELPEFRHLESW